MVDRRGRGQAGLDGALRKLALVLALSAVYAIIGWIGPGGAEQLVAFYGKYPLLLVVLGITTVLACIAATILGIVVLSAVLPERKRKARRRELPPEPRPPRPSPPAIQPSIRVPLRDRLAATRHRLASSVPALRREARRLLIATFAGMAAHVSIVLTGILRQPYDSTALFAHATAVVMPFAGWGTLAMADYINSSLLGRVHGDLAAMPENEPAAVHPPSEKKPREGKPARGLAFSVACWSGLTAATVFTPPNLPLLVLILLACVADVALRVGAIKVSWKTAAGKA
jgi:hypothetical protein